MIFKINEEYAGYCKNTMLFFSILDKLNGISIYLYFIFKIFDLKELFNLNFKDIFSKLSSTKISSTSFFAFGPALYSESSYIDTIYFFILPFLY